MIREIDGILMFENRGVKLMILTLHFCSFVDGESICSYNLYCIEYK